MTSSAKGFFRLMLLVLLIAAAAIYMMMYQERIATILGGCLMAIVIIFIGYVNIPPLFNYLKERATDIMNVYPDVSGRACISFQISPYQGGSSACRPYEAFNTIFC